MSYEPSCPPPVYEGKRLLARFIFPAIRAESGVCLGIPGTLDAVEDDPVGRKEPGTLWFLFLVASTAAITFQYVGDCHVGTLGVEPSATKLQRIR